MRDALDRSILDRFVRGDQEAFEAVYKPGRVYESDAEQNARYAERFEVFQQVYPALKELNSRLHGMSY